MLAVPLVSELSGMVIGAIAVFDKFTLLDRRQYAMKNRVKAVYDQDDEAVGELSVVCILMGIRYLSSSRSMSCWLLRRSGSVINWRCFTHPVRIR